MLLAKKGRRIDHCEQARTKLVEAMQEVWRSESKSEQLTEKQAERVAKRIANIAQNLSDICIK